MKLLRHGVLHTMTGLHPVEADILMEGGRIVRIINTSDPAPDVCPDGSVEEIDLSGCHVCPGLIDPHLRFSPQSGEENLLAQMESAALEAGMTMALVCPEGNGACHLLGSGELRDIPAAVHVAVDRLTESELLSAMRAAVEQGTTLIARIDSPAQLEMMLRCQKAHPARLVLTHLLNCETMVDSIAASGCGVMMSACFAQQQNSAYAMAAALHGAGVPVALTTDYPSTRMRHLTLCAALCARAGMRTEEALRAITLVPAELLGLSGHVGTIEVGKYANLTVFDGEPLRLSSSVKMTVHFGECLRGNHASIFAR